MKVKSKSPNTTQKFISGFPKLWDIQWKQLHCGIVYTWQTQFSFVCHFWVQAIDLLLKSMVNTAPFLSIFSHYHKLSVVNPHLCHCWILQGAHRIYEVFTYSYSAFQAFVYLINLCMCFRICHITQSRLYTLLALDDFTIKAFFIFWPGVCIWKFVNPDIWYDLAVYMVIYHMLAAYTGENVSAMHFTCCELSMEWCFPFKNTDKSFKYYGYNFSCWGRLANQTR